MKSTNPALVLGLAVLLGVAAGGCAAALCQPDEPSVNCCIKNEGWMGSCYDCLRYCEGQQDWPFNKCRKRKKESP